MRQLAAAAFGWLLKSLFTAVLPVVAVLALAVLDGMVRTVALAAIFPLMLIAHTAMRVSSAAGHAIPLPRLPRPAEVTL